MLFAFGLRSVPFERRPRCQHVRFEKSLGLEQSIVGIAKLATPKPET